MGNTLIVILGPTGIGKTALSLKVAQNFNSDILSSDSRQIFKELQIGTASPTPQQLHTVKHHFVKTISIHDYYSAAKFESDVITQLPKLFEKNKIQLLSGGSMLYLDAVCKGIDDIPTIDKEIRLNLTNRFNDFGIEPLRTELKKIDPHYYHEVDLKNPKRIIHALEVFYMTGKPFSSLRTNQHKTRAFNIIKIGLNTDRQLLHERINKRVDEMMESGLLEEAKSVYPYKHLNSLKTVGYQELFNYFDGQYTLEHAIEKIKTNSRRYAKKQLTWFKKDDAINWFKPEETNEVLHFLNTTLGQLI